MAQDFRVLSSSKILRIKKRFNYKKKKVNLVLKNVIIGDVHSVSEKLISFNNSVI